MSVLNSELQLLELKDVSYTYPSMHQGTFVIDRISLGIKTSEIIQIKGRNGSGKTTLLRILAGELSPSKGKRDEIKTGLRSMYLNQNTGDFLGESLTVREQLAMNMRGTISLFQNIRKGALDKYLKEFLSEYGVGLEDNLNAFTCELSGGQRQIVALLSVIEGEVDILVLDEFTAHMDPESINESKRLVRNLVNRRQVAVVFSSHQDEFSYCNKVIEL